MFLTVAVWADKLKIFKSIVGPVAIFMVDL